MGRRGSARFASAGEGDDAEDEEAEDEEIARPDAERRSVIARRFSRLQPLSIMERQAMR